MPDDRIFAHMETAIKPVISPVAALPLLTHDHVVVIDARGGPDPFARFEKAHIEGALFLDLDRDLSQLPKNPAYGGRHPLPGIHTFAALLGKLGIEPGSHVLVYDDKNGANAAARFWWMLRAAGHGKVQVIDGGLAAIVEAGLPVSTTSSDTVALAPYPAEKWKLPVVDLETVEQAAADPRAVVIDVREAYRYQGESEPIDLIAGHIPGAINVPYVENLDEKGAFLPPGQLRQKYAAAIGAAEEVIVHCGSGVTACLTLLALEQAGIQGAKLYAGSWSEWSRRNKPVARGATS